MSLQESIDLSNIVPLTPLTSFDVDITEIPTQNMWIGTRYSIDGDFFEDYDFTNYCNDPQVVIFAKVKYPDGYIYYYDIKNNKDAPIDTCFMNDRIAKYQIYPYCPLSKYLQPVPIVSSINELIELLPIELRKYILSQIQYNDRKDFCSKMRRFKLPQ